MIEMLIAGFIPESFVDWRGKLVATVFTHGCNFRCPFCHNYLLVTEKLDRAIPVEDVIEKIESLKGWVDGVCITGGEPTIHPDLLEFIRELSRITEVKLDTNGTNPDILRESLPYLSYVAMDIKAPKEKYQSMVGVPVNMENIEKSIELIKNQAKDYEFRTTAVPLLSMDDYAKIAEWIAVSKRYVIQQYSSDQGTLNPEFAQLKPYDEKWLQKVCEKIREKFKECLVVNV